MKIRLKIETMRQMILMVVYAASALSMAACNERVMAQDEVTVWNNQLLNAIRQQPSGPPTMARNGAMVMTAMYNAVNAIDQTHQSYGGFSTVVDVGTSKQAAAAQAAHDVMQHLYPTLGAQWSNQLATSLSVIPNGPSRTAGIALGNASASHMIGLRANDGTSNPGTYVAGTNPGDYSNPNSGSRNDAVEPNAGNYTPWSMTSGNQFRPDRLTNYGTMTNFMASNEYLNAYNQVKQVGSINSWTPADEEYKIAFFWANDRSGTYKPPGHLNKITQTFAQRQFAALSPDERLSQNARLFALLNMAMADAGVAAWDAKYNTDFDLWRPITAIRNADTDGNPGTIGESTWEPLNHVDPDGAGPMTADPFTPPFPAYISGHATFGAAHAAIMRSFFGGIDLIDGGPLTIGTDDPFVPGLTRTFSSWEAMARENGLSRVYLGVHYQFDADDGYTTGDQVGSWMFSNQLQAIPEPSSAFLLGGYSMLMLFRRHRK
jgi:PAP2 superfamily